MQRHVLFASHDDTINIHARLIHHNSSKACSGYTVRHQSRSLEEAW